MMADDDPDDQMIVEEGWKENAVSCDLKFVDDGQALIDYLNNLKEKPEGERIFPCVILLDLNMPIKDGRQTLKEIKEDASLHKIPVIAFTTSKTKADIEQSYEFGANSFVTKPSRFEDVVHTLKSICEYWLKTVKLP